MILVSEDIRPNLGNQRGRPRDSQERRQVPAGIGDPGRCRATPTFFIQVGL